MSMSQVPTGIRLFVSVLFVVGAVGVRYELRAAEEIPAREAEQLLESVQEIVFAVRQRGKNGHYYVNFGNWCGNPDKWEYGSGGRLCILNVRTGKTTTLLDDPPGGVRDPQVYYDGKKILFSYRPGNTHRYHLYEIGIDGSGLRQLTEGDYDDIEPTYLPDGRIMFCSTRCNRIVNCNLVQVALLFTCDADGTNIRQISANNETENTPWPLPDGRVMYTRWEYVDRGIGGFKGLWTTNPDGTAQMPLFGNVHPMATMLDAKPIPGTGQVVAVHSGHMNFEHHGSISVIDLKTGPDNKKAERRITKNGMYRDPYPLGQAAFLVAEDSRILVMDYQGRTKTLLKLPDRDTKGGLWCHEPRPVQTRPREKLIPDRVDRSQTTGTLVLADVRHGRNMVGVEQGEIKQLLVLETLPKPVNFSGRADPYGFNHSFTLERVLGTVPVEADGSAHFEVPASRALFFAALDEQGRAVRRMQSFLTVQPGETIGCVGCHEERTGTLRAENYSDLAALRRRPSRITPLANVPQVFDFPRDIQPILDRHCVACHDYEATLQGGPRAGGVVLSGDRGPVYSHGFATVHLRNLVVMPRDGNGNKPPRSIASGASPLLDYLDGGHYDVRLTELERRIVRTWIDAAGSYAGTYAASGTGKLPKSPGWPEVSAAAATIRERCTSCHEGERRLPEHPMDEVGIDGYTIVEESAPRRLSNHLVYNLTRPKKSMMLLAPLAQEAGGYGTCKQAGIGVFVDTDDPGYQSLLAMVRRGQEELQRDRRFDMPGFRPSQHYVRVMTELGVLPRDLPDDAKIDVYATDEAYWRTFWPQ